MIFDRGKGKIPGAGVVDLVAAEGFFEFGKTVPGVLRIFGGGDAPEIEAGGAAVFGVENHLHEDDDAGVDFAVFIVGGGVGIEASSGVVVDQGSGEGLALELGDVEGGETGFELISEVGFGLGMEIVFFTDGLEEGSKDENFVRVFRLTNLEAFFGATTPVLDAGGAHLFQDVGTGLGEVDGPGMSGVEVVGFIEVERLSGGCGEGEGRFDADEKRVMFAGEIGKGIKGGLESIFWVFGSFKSWAVGAIEVVTKRRGMEDGKGGEVGFVEAESLVAFKLFVFFPGRGLKKMLIHEDIITRLGLR